MSSSATYHQNQLQRTPRATRRPASIAELAQRAKDDHYDDRRELKYHLRNAEKYRRTAKELVKAGDLEAAFVEFAKASTLVLEKIPTHRDYHGMLTSEQRRNLALVGIFFWFSSVLCSPSHCIRSRDDLANIQEAPLVEANTSNRLWLYTIQHGYLPLDHVSATEIDDSRSGIRVHL
jgi:hypothetical protein